PAPSAVPVTPTEYAGRYGLGDDPPWTHELLVEDDGRLLLVPGNSTAATPPPNYRLALCDEDALVCVEPEAAEGLRGSFGRSPDQERLALPDRHPDPAVPHRLPRRREVVLQVGRGDLVHASSLGDPPQLVGAEVAQDGVSRRRAERLCNSTRAEDLPPVRSAAESRHLVDREAHVLPARHRHRSLVDAHAHPQSH